MSSGPALGGDKPSDARNSTQMLMGWKHLQRALGTNLAQSVKRSRALSRAQLRRKG